MAKRSTPASQQSMNLLVTIDPKHRGQLDQVVQRLKAAGMAVEDVLRSSGVVCGKATSSEMNTLRKVEGVAAVEQEPNFHTQD